MESLIRGNGNTRQSDLQIQHNLDQKLSFAQTDKLILKFTWKFEVPLKVKAIRKRAKLED